MLFFMYRIKKDNIRGLLLLAKFVGGAGGKHNFFGIIVRLPARLILLVSRLSYVEKLLGLWRDYFRRKKLVQNNSWEAY